ncbi:MAG: preprotein translocase subunit SecG [Patescibacteria group bacterium]
MTTVIQISQFASAILVVVSILLQHRGTGLGGAFGGNDTSYRSRRGVERVLFRATIVFAAIFIVSAIARIFV